MTDVERIEIDEIIKQFFWNMNRVEIKVLKLKMKYVSIKHLTNSVSKI